MQDADGTSGRMLPFWVQWLFAAVGITLLVVAFAAIWTKLVRIEKRFVRFENQQRATMGNAPPPGDDQ